MAGTFNHSDRLSPVRLDLPLRQSRKDSSGNFVSVTVSEAVSTTTSETVAERVQRVPKRRSLAHTPLRSEPVQSIHELVSRHNVVPASLPPIKLVPVSSPLKNPPSSDVIVPSMPSSPEGSIHLNDISPIKRTAGQSSAPRKLQRLSFPATALAESYTIDEFDQRSGVDKAHLNNRESIISTSLRDSLSPDITVSATIFPRKDDGYRININDNAIDLPFSPQGPQINDENAPHSVSPALPAIMQGEHITAVLPGQASPPYPIESKRLSQLPLETSGQFLASHTSHDSPHGTDAKLLESPPSPAIFSLKQLQLIQGNDRAHLNSLKITNDSINSTIQLQKTEIAALNDEILAKERQLSDLRFEQQNASRELHIAHIQRERSENSLAHAAQTLASLQDQLAQANSKLAELESVKYELEKAKSLMLERDADITSLESRIEHLNTQLTEKDSHIQSQDRDLQAAATAHATVQSRLAALEQENRQLDTRVQDLKEYIAKQDEYVTQLDHTNNVGRAKILSLERDLEIQQREYRDALAEHEIESLRLASDVATAKRDALKAQSDLSVATSELHEAKLNVQDLSLRVRRLESDAEASVRLREDETSALRQQLREREEELASKTEQLNVQLDRASSAAADYDSQLHNAREQVLKFQSQLAASATTANELDFYKQKLKQQEQDHLNKIDEISDYLHKQYAEKHTRKMGELRELYDQELISRESELKRMTREIALLTSRLSRTSEERERLLEFVTVHKLKYPGSSS